MDQKLLLLINREWVSAGADRVMALASCWDAWVLPMICLAVGISLFGGFKGRAFLVAASLVVAVNDGLLSNGLKHLIDRPRPGQLLSDVRQVDLAKGRPRLFQLLRPLQVKLSRPNPADQAGRSFPSSHTMNTISAALVALCFYGRRCWWTLPLAGVVAYSRIYTGSHWPSDVLTSICLGVGSTLLLLAGLETLWQRQAPVRWPSAHALHPTLYAG